MLIYAGIDEAGYGPMFGPLVIARTVFQIADADAAAEPPVLWDTLQSAVCRGGRDARRRIAVDDSKKLYTPAKGLEKLERGVLAFAGLAGWDPATLTELLNAAGLDDASRTPSLLWYHDDHDAPALPITVDGALLAIARGQLVRSAAGGNVTLPEVRAAVVFEDRFNQIVASTRSKASCAWRFVAQHLMEIWQRYGRHHPRIVVDRQGGRKVYHPQLQMLFEGAELRLLDESDDVSCYRLRHGDRAMTVSFEIGSEQRHLPVALASMTAKYLREALMVRFNRFWAAHVVDLRPTAGYVQDGRRFLAEIEQHIDRLGIDRQTLIRSI